MVINWVDLLIITILIFFTIRGVGKPFLFELYDLLGFILAFIVSLNFYSYAASYLERLFPLPHSFANPLGFFILWYIVDILFIISGRFLLPLVQFVRFPGDGILSAVPAFLRGVLFVSLILLLISSFPFPENFKKDVNKSYLGVQILNKTFRYEASLKGVFGGLTNETLTFLTIRSQSSEKVKLDFKTEEFSFDENKEMAMIDLINQERVKNNLPLLVFDLNLQQIGRMHSADMFTKGYFAHYSPEGENVAGRAQLIGVDFNVIGENLAYAPSLELAHNGLMNSQGHRENILSKDYQKVGIGVADGGKYGLMFTQVFSN